MEPSGMFGMSLILIAVGVVLCFPPVWNLSLIETTVNGRHGGVPDEKRRSRLRP